MDSGDRHALARSTPGAGLKDYATDIDMKRLRAYRLGRVQAGLKAKGYGAAVLYDPINIRYACGSTNMQVWVLHNASRYAFVPAEGLVTLFEFHNCEFLSKGLETIGHTRVTGIVVEKGEVSGVETDRGSIRTPLVVDAAGVWSRALGK